MINNMRIIHYDFYLYFCIAWISITTLFFFKKVKFPKTEPILYRIGWKLPIIGNIGIVIDSLVHNYVIYIMHWSIIMHWIVIPSVILMVVFINIGIYQKVMRPDCDSGRKNAYFTGIYSLIGLFVMFGILMLCVELYSRLHWIVLPPIILILNFLNMWLYQKTRRFDFDIAKKKAIFMCWYIAGGFLVLIGGVILIANI